VTTINATEGPAYGVALLAMVGTGAYATVPQACDAIKVTEELQPNDHSRQGYEQYYGVYRRLYSDLKPEFENIARIKVSN
jgi:xylulokinase